MDDKELELARQAQNAYMRQYRVKNKDKVKAINNKYWINKAKRDSTEPQEAK